MTLLHEPLKRKRRGHKPLSFLNFFELNFSNPNFVDKILENFSKSLDIFTNKLYYIIASKKRKVKESRVFLDFEKMIVLDTETANSLDNPLVYDFGVAVVDKKGKVYESFSYVIRDVFFDERELMKTSYYHEKLPQYWADIKSGKRKIRTILEAKKELNSLIKKYDVTKVFAHNMRFDLNALNTTIRYVTKSKIRYFFPKNVLLCDTLRMARQVFGFDREYEKFCRENQFITNSQLVQLTAEVIYRFLTKDVNFEESHTGLEDVLIEKEILKECCKYRGIEYLLKGKATDAKFKENVYGERLKVIRRGTG